METSVQMLSICLIHSSRKIKEKSISKEEMIIFLTQINALYGGDLHNNNLQNNACMKMADTYWEHYKTPSGWFISNFLKKKHGKNCFSKARLKPG